VPAVIFGGVGTLVVVGLWAWIFPQLRQMDRLIPVREIESEAKQQEVV
jgi:hypothetical protein